MFHELQDIWWDSLNPREKERHHAWIIKTTGRSSGAPPIEAPYDFGIDLKWWETAQEKYPEYVKDWFTYGDLEGFGEEENAEEENAEEENEEMDEERGADGENRPADGN